MSKKKNPNGSRVERENKFADALGLGTGRTFMGACLSAFESGAEIEISFFHSGQRKSYRTYPVSQSVPARPLEAQGDTGGEL